jgi:hypothetical protein
LPGIAIFSGIIPIFTSILYCSPNPTILMGLFTNHTKTPVQRLGPASKRDHLALDQLGDHLIEQGARLIKQEIEGGIQSIVTMDRKGKLGHALKPEAFLSDNLRVNPDLPASVRDQVEQRREDTRAVLHAIAHEIEGRHFQHAEAGVAQIDLLSHQKARIQSILQTQKQINYSFRTLEVVIGVFQRYNAELLSEMAANPERSQHLNLRMENALLVYELLDFAHQAIERFTLSGVEDLKAIKEAVFADIKEAEAEQRDLTKKLRKASDHAQESISKTIEDRKRIFVRMKDRWKDMEQRVTAVIAQVKEVKKILPDLDAYRLNAKIHIRVLSLVAIMNMVEKNLEIVEQFADTDWDLLAPFEPDDYLALVGEQPEGW